MHFDELRLRTVRLTNFEKEKNSKDLKKLERIEELQKTLLDFNRRKFEAQKENSKETRKELSLEPKRKRTTKVTEWQENSKSSARLLNTKKGCRMKRIPKIVEILPYIRCHIYGDYSW